MRRVSKEGVSRAREGERGLVRRMIEGWWGRCEGVSEEGVRGLVGRV